MLALAVQSIPLSAWWIAAAALPVLLLGEFLIGVIKPLASFDLPAPIVGGLLVAVVVLLLNLTRTMDLTLSNKVSTPAWTWLVTPEPEWKKSPLVPVYLPFSTAFFCCVGLNASWSVAKKGSWQLLLMVALATLLGVLQNLLGVEIARQLHQNPLLGLICGSVTLTGGPSTALGFAGVFEKAGFHGADVVGAAAAMFGIVAASLLAGAFGGGLIRWFKLAGPAEISSTAQPARRSRRTFFDHLRFLNDSGPGVLSTILVVLVCMKLGAWLSFGMTALKITLPVYMGAMILAVILRNITDAIGRPIVKTEIVQPIASVALGLFLAMAMAGLNLLQLKTLAGPMIVILLNETLMTVLFVLVITYAAMGRDYDAAVSSAGHLGFALGITPNAVATMDVLEQKFRPSPRAVLVVTIVGGFLIDFTNSVIITFHMNFLNR